jgi:hypothetical protein
MHIKNVKNIVLKIQKVANKLEINNQKTQKKVYNKKNSSSYSLDTFMPTKDSYAHFRCEQHISILILYLQVTKISQVNL